jgi:hypothetical protein
MTKPQGMILAAILAVVVLGGVGWMAFAKSGDGSTRIENPPPPDAATVLQPVPGHETATAPGGAPGQPPQVDANGAAVIQ